MKKKNRESFLNEKSIESVNAPPPLKLTRKPSLTWNKKKPLSKFAIKSESPIARNSHFTI